MKKLAEELVALSPGEIKTLPIDDFTKREILAAGPLSGGARVRQIKFIAKELRGCEDDHHKLGEFLARRKGSRIREEEKLHELESLRQAIITEAIVAMEEARALDLPLLNDWPSSGLERAQRAFPDLDSANIRVLAGRYARSRKVAYSREIFRQLKGLQDQQRLRT